MNISTYELIANEYYDTRHITSRNFDEATLAFCNNSNIQVPSRGLVLELGCGKGCTKKYCNVASSRIVQTDISKAMLSITPREDCLLRLRCNALQLPFLHPQFCAVTAFLYDPYNTLELYTQIYNVLLDGGVFIGTLPHFKWGKTLRDLLGHRENKSQFLTKENKIIEFDSFLMDDSDIESALKKSGLTLVQMNDLYLPRRVEKVSEHVSIPANAVSVSVYDLPIVKFIMARKSP